eukprot:TRINITY_DN24269_c0_g2_i1.p1 TRINITY_DN24269_c0_g2~~TRINITY_DN24269_c0_g2_i1.p1  ORF type:complete len:209 (+),score=19.25 TRINITY_DN24269_c0_g2_i1:32-658(+)
MASDPFKVGTWNPESLTDLAASVGDAETKPSAQILRSCEMKRLSQPMSPTLFVERQVDLMTSSHTPRCLRGIRSPLKERPGHAEVPKRPATAVEGIFKYRPSRDSASSRRKVLPSVVSMARQNHNYVPDQERFLLQEGEARIARSPEALLQPRAHLYSRWATSSQIMTSSSCPALGSTPHSASKRDQTRARFKKAMTLVQVLRAFRVD